MKKNLKGFTLIECLVALTILGVASLVMAQIYANVCKINRANHETNSSIAYQMKHIEIKDNMEAIRVASGEAKDPSTNMINTVPVHKRASSGTTINQITIKKLSVNSSPSYTEEYEYSYPVDYYVLQSRDQNGEAAYIYNSSTDTWDENPKYKGTREDDYYLNYKYLLGARIE